MATLMTLELHYPTNWAYEGEVDVLYCDGSSETSYGRLAQGQTMSRETYEGHRWAVREANNPHPKPDSSTPPSPSPSRARTRTRTITRTRARRPRASC